MSNIRGGKIRAGLQYRNDLELQPSNDLEYDAATFDLDCKDKVECICPKCGVKHSMVFRWIGRGVPRKFCKSCHSIE